MTKPFNLEKAKAGEPVQTRDGRRARILCFDRDCDTFPIVGLQATGDGEEVLCWTNKGSASAVSNLTTLDLMMAPRKREGWVNIYTTAAGNTHVGPGIYDSEEEATKYAQSSGRLTAIKIQWEE